MHINQSSAAGSDGPLSSSLPAPRLSSCPKLWAEMSGDNRTRFCDHCNLHVHNLSEMPRQEAEVLMNPIDKRVCVTYIPDAEGNVLTLDQRKANAAAALAEAAEIEAEMMAAGSGPAPLTQRWERLGNRSRWSFTGLLAGLAAGFAGLLSAHASAAPANAASGNNTFATPPAARSSEKLKSRPQPEEKAKPAPEPPPMLPGAIMPPPPTPPATNKPRPPIMGKICPPSTPAPKSQEK
ncbi:MAG: hypothetical protein ACAI35_05225 [Candidatus Methylacidiphilales bacterium]|nr:hypothetical protein [Candidatus Methylacidiphilales bacterium]